MWLIYSGGAWVENSLAADVLHCSMQRGSILGCDLLVEVKRENYFKILDNTYFTVVKQASKQTKHTTVPPKPEPVSYNYDTNFEYICCLTSLSKLEFM